jgi:integrase
MKTARQVAALKAPGRYAVGDGAYLQITGDNGRSWVFRYERAGRGHHVGLGPANLVTLAEAREKARAYRRLLLEGVDPIESRADARQKAALDAAKAVTFRQCAERYIAAHEAAWRNATHRKQWRSTLATYVYPTLGSLPASAIDTALVTQVLEPIWTTKTETAGRVRGRIEAVLDWAKVRGIRNGDNPARWKGHLDKLLPKRSRVKRRRHHPALPYAELPGFMVELRAREGISARALEFAILTAARTGAVIGATDGEVDLATKIWTVPPERTGVKITREDPKPRRVPLPDRAVAILKALPREAGNPHFFAGAKAGKPLSNMAMLELMRDMRAGYVPHGFRSTFKDWCAETTNYPNEVSEAALWHTVADEVEAAYRRGDLFEKRRRLMADWAEFCSSKPAPRGDVIPINARR